MGLVAITPTTETEMAVLADLLTPGVADRYSGLLRTADFTDILHQMAFDAIQAVLLERKPITLQTVNEQLEKRAGSMAGDALSALIEAQLRYGFAKGLTADENVRILKERSTRRQGYSLLADAAEQLQNQSYSTEEVFEAVRTGLKTLENDKLDDDIISLEQVLIKAYTHIEDIQKGKDKAILTGVTGLDNITAGLHRGEMTIIGARPSVGKSALAMQIALTAGLNNAKVLVCSREMTDIQYGMRVLLRDTTLDGKKLRSGNVSESDWAQLSDTLMRYSAIADTNFTFKAKFTEDLRRLVERRANSEGLDVLIVDYTQLMQTRQKADKDYVRLGIISKSLKDIAVDYNIAVVALAQVGRTSDGKMPTMAELRGSGDLEQDADNIIFMYRAVGSGDREVAPQDRDKIAGWQMQGLEYIVLNVVKQRQGETGKTAVLFQPRTLQYASIPREMDEP